MRRLTVLLTVVLVFTTARSSGAQIVIRTLRETPLRAQSSQGAIILRHLRKGVRLTLANLWVDTNFVARLTIASQMVPASPALLLASLAAEQGRSATSRFHDLSTIAHANLRHPIRNHRLV